MRARVRLTSFTAALALAVAGCQSTGSLTGREVSPDELQGGIAELSRALPGTMGALYRLRGKSSGGLRLSILTGVGGGRMTISEPFGSALSLTAWSDDGSTQFFDLKKGCKVEVDDVSSLLGVARLPLPAAVRLLGGRLPVGEGMSVEIQTDGRVLVQGQGWACVLTLRPDPWRVVRAEQAFAQGSGWLIDLDRHTSSLPGFVSLAHPDGRRAELELVRLEWNHGSQLAPLPELGTCPRTRTEDGSKDNER